MSFFTDVLNYAGFDGPATEQANHDAMTNQWAMWNANNEYNTPIAQRARLVEAGYSPALMYGNGNVGNSSPTSLSPMQTPKKGNAIAEGSALVADLALKKAQLENIEADTDNKRATNPLISSNAGIKDLDYGRILQNYDNTVATELEKTKGIRLDNEIKALQKQTIEPKQKALLDNIQSQIQLRIKAGQRLDMQNLLDSFEAKLNEYGLSKHDELWQRVSALLLQNMGVNLKQK